MHINNGRLYWNPPPTIYTRTKSSPRFAYACIMLLQVPKTTTFRSKGIVSDAGYSDDMR